MPWSGVGAGEIFESTTDKISSSNLKIEKAAPYLSLTVYHFSACISFNNDFLVHAFGLIQKCTIGKYTYFLS